MRLMAVENAVAGNAVAGNAVSENAVAGNAVAGNAVAAWEQRADTVQIALSAT